MEHQHSSSTELEPTLSSDGKFLTFYKNTSIVREDFNVDNMLQDKLWYDKHTTLTHPGFILPTSAAFFAGLMVASRAISSITANKESTYTESALMGTIIGTFLGLYISLNVILNRSDNESMLETLDKVRKKNFKRR